MLPIMLQRIQLQECFQQDLTFQHKMRKESMLKMVKKTLNEYTITQFNRFALRIPVRSEIVKRSYTPREMTYGQLKKKIKDTVVNNLDPAPFRTEVNLRISIAFAPLIFGLLGTVLGIRLKKGSQAVGFGISIVVILFYYGLLLLSISLSTRGLVPSFILTWFPNFVTILAGMFLWSRLARQ